MTRFLYFSLNSTLSSVSQSHPTLWDTMDWHTRVPCPSQSLSKFLSIKSVMLSSHLILCHSLLLLPSIFPSIRFLSLSQLFASGGRSTGASTSASVFSVNIQGWYFRIDWLDPLAVQGTLKSFVEHHIQKHQLFSAQPSSWSNSHISTWLKEKP